MRRNTKQEQYSGCVEGRSFIQRWRTYVFPMKTLFLAALLVLFTNISHAQSECEAVAWGEGYTEYSLEGRQFTYQIRNKGDESSQHWYGSHGTAAVCEECEDREHSWGLLRLGDVSRPYREVAKISDPCYKMLSDPTSTLPPEALLPSYTCEAPKAIQGKMIFPPRTAKEQVSQGYEWLQYPVWTLRTDDLLPVHLTDDLHIGDLRGFGVAYEIVDPSAFNLPDNVNGLLSFEVDDTVFL